MEITWRSRGDHAEITSTSLVEIKWRGCRGSLAARRGAGAPGKEGGATLILGYKQYAYF